MNGIDTAGGTQPRIRLTGILIENGHLLIVRQRRRRHTNWNLPGGQLEAGETVAAGLTRELFEETGLAVEVGELLYVTDRFRGQGRQDVDLAFEVRPAGGIDAPYALCKAHANDAGEIDGIMLAPIPLLTTFGFGPCFVELARNEFPGRGTYRGDFHEFYGSGPADAREGKDGMGDVRRSEGEPGDPTHCSARYRPGPAHCAPRHKAAPSCCI